jgi:hypothetical protein
MALAVLLSLLTFSHVGETLPMDSLHHKHHIVVLLILATSPPYLAGPRKRIRRCATYVHCSEAPLVAVLDWDRIARKDLYDLSSMFSLTVSLYDLQGYVDLIYISRCFTSHRLDLGSLLFVFVRFFILYVAKPFIHVVQKIAVSLET